jgi:hypothetical protein
VEDMCTSLAGLGSNEYRSTRAITDEGSSAGGIDSLTCNFFLGFGAMISSVDVERRHGPERSRDANPMCQISLQQ